MWATSEFQNREREAVRGKSKAESRGREAAKPGLTSRRKLTWIVLGVFDLFAERYEKAADPDFARAIGNEGRDCTAVVRVDGVGGARFGRVFFRLKQPAAFTKLNAGDAFLFRRTKLIGRFPSVEINQAVRSGPRSLTNTKSVIAVAAKLR